MRTTSRTAAEVVILATLFAHGQTARKAAFAPTELKLARTATAELAAETLFSLQMSAPGFPHTEFSMKPDSGSLHVTCTWETDTQLLLSVTAAAGHGLPGRIGLGSRMGGSPLTIDVEIGSEQAARGPVYIEISASPPYRSAKGTVRGRLAASLTSSGTEIAADEEPSGDSIEEGRLLSPAEAREMEGKLTADPKDWSARLTLLSYYSSGAALRARRAETIAARHKHILWAIENRSGAPEIFDLPELHIDKSGPLADPAGLRDAEQAWQRATAGGERQVFLNAALFSATADPAFAECILREGKSTVHDEFEWDGPLGWLYATAIMAGQDPGFANHAKDVLNTSNTVSLLAAAAPVLAQPESKFSTTPVKAWLVPSRHVQLAEQLATRAVAADPKNPYALVSLLEVLTVEAGTATTSEQRVGAGKKVYTLFKQFDDLAVGRAQRMVFLPVMANLAFEVKDDEAARKYANQTLDLALQPEDRVHATPNGPLAFHDANDVLGRLALRDGDLEQAKEYLLKAATLPNGRAIEAPGPRMLLAQALLDRGEREFVLQYLLKMKTSWPSGVTQIGYWSAEIRKDKPVRLNLVDTVPLAGQRQ